MQVDDILAKLTAMPEAAQREACAHALEATKDMVFIPSPGPQFEAYVSEADVTLFGGSPGGGKTALEIGLALNQHHRSLIVRKNFVDLGGVLHTLDNIIGKENAATGGNRPVYKKPEGGVIEFMGLGENIDSKQGNPHDLICVGNGTPVLMGDGSYKPVEEVCVGDKVATLEGPRRVLNSFPTLPKDSVRVTLPSGVSQVQSATHKLLTTSGWVSRDGYDAPPPCGIGGPCFERGGDRSGLLLLAGAVPRSPTHLQEGGGGTTQTRSHRGLWYAHPYTMAPRRSCVSLLESPCSVSPVGKAELFDLEVEEVNHFITMGGFVNKNCVDEAAQVPEHQVRMLIGWMRTDKPGQRCRMVLGSNPPLNSTGDWLITYFAPWLDPHYPKPAQEGELRYFLPDPEGGDDRECGKDDFVMMHGVKVPALSRTYISSKFTDNPFYDKEQYAKALAGLPKEMRDILVSGNFLTDRSDDAFQVIPTAWIKEAQARWTAATPVGVPLCAIGADVAQGGTDRSVLAKRYDGYYAKLEVKPGKDTPDGKTYGGWVITNRRDSAKVIIDIGGGWGGDAYAHLRENGVDAVGYMGVKATEAKTTDNLLGFENVRSMAYWRFREALDPSQPGGSRIALPPDPEMVADLCAPTYEIVKRANKGGKIKIESKEDVCAKLARSTDKGDAVVMAWTDGLKMTSMLGGEWKTRKARPQVIVHRRRP
jgi:hypothetical protein